MKVWTFGDLITAAQNETDTANEDFAIPDELVGYYNDGVHEAESEILTIYEDYFLNYATLTLTQGQAAISLPSDCYASKIRALIYVNGSTIYPVQRFRQGANRKFFEIELINSQSTSDDYQYLLTNTSATNGYQIYLVPAARETGAYGKLWYIRNALRVSTASELSQEPTDPLTSGQKATKVDIPEFYTFLKEYVKGKIRAKENGGVIPSESVAVIQQQRQMMVDTLTRMVPDDDDRIVPDVSHYAEHE